MEISKTKPDGLTLGDLYDLVADATELGLARDSEIYARCKVEIRFDRPPAVLSLTLSGDREQRS